MQTNIKKRQLFLYKFFATALFLLMAILFLSFTFLQKNHTESWLGYARAFCEAAMVGALADWFAVTALFHYPLGIKIPHTNIIEKSKNKIGDNLGLFVVENFLTPQNIRPYISKLKVSNFAGQWLAKTDNQHLIVAELSAILSNIVEKLENDSVVNFIKIKANSLSKDINIQKMVGTGLEYLVEKNDHQKLITSLARQIKLYVLQHQNLVQERVKKESFSLIPKFVDEALAKKITKGLAEYFREVEENVAHPLRAEITKKLLEFSQDIGVNDKWTSEFNVLKDNFLNSDKMSSYAEDIWQSLKANLAEELSNENSKLKNYLMKNIAILAENLQIDILLQQKIDAWVRFTAYKYILKNSHLFGDLISSTVGKWEGKELSEKLELEVGKDLQFIRVNGTLVGGLVGLVIYTIAHFIS